MTDHVELDITVTSANGETARYSAEYAPVDQTHIDCALNEIVKGVDPTVRARMTPVSDQS